MVKTVIILVAALISFSACSGDEQGSSENKGGGDHVWKEQTQAIDKAKEVEGLLQDASDQQRKAIDE